LRKNKGILIHSENFQVLQLLKNRYTQAIKTIYIDPPYNTDSAPILYKNGYRHSTWASLMFDRLSHSMGFLTENGVKIVAIDDTELVPLSKILEQIAPNFRLTRTTVVHNPKGSITKDFNRVHEYALYLTRENKKNVIARTLEENETPRKMRRWGANSLRTERKQSFYPIYVLNGEITRIGIVPDDNFHPQGRNVTLETGEIEIWPIDQNGIERRWNFGLDAIEDNLDRITILEVDGTFDLFVTHELSVPKTVWTGGDYDAGNHGNTLLVNIIGEKLFDFPKSIKLVERSISISTGEDDSGIVFDFFAGSGTTAHATINLNRKDQKTRKYILVEMGLYFDTVVKPRTQRVIYSDEWRDGKPVSRKGSSHAFKYIKLESYEDTLNNLELERTEEQVQALLSAESFREDYLLHYMLDFESKGSLLDLQVFDNPFDYQLKIASSTVGETVPTRVDLVETFNYLIGLQIRTIRKVDGVVLVEGQTRDSKNALVIWRNTNELDSEALNTFFTEHLAERQKEFDTIYVNGDNTLANIRPQNATWKVHLTEEEFHYRMFEER
jgi:adenine-specific DNA-methyltransferase